MAGYENSAGLKSPEDRGVEARILEAQATLEATVRRPLTLTEIDSIKTMAQGQQERGYQGPILEESEAVE